MCIILSNKTDFPQNDGIFLKGDAKDTCASFKYFISVS